MNEKYKNLLESQEFQKLYPQFFETFSNGTISLKPGSESLAVREYARYKRKEQNQCSMATKRNIVNTIPEYVIVDRAIPASINDALKG